MTDNTKNVDWTQPVEAVHEDGRVSSVRLFGGPYSGCCYYIQGLDWAYFRADGTHIGDGCPWTIRNVAEAKAEEFGPEIKVEGRRPEWLGEYRGHLGYMRSNGTWYGPNKNWWSEDDIVNNESGWASVTAIRLPANHPHYKTLQAGIPQSAPETHRQGTNGVRTSQECLERMEALVRRMAGGFYMHGVNETGIGMTDAIVQAQQIVRDLPEPVDPDLVEARRMCQYAINKDGDSYVGGQRDEGYFIKSMIAAIKRGRALERGEG